MKNLTRIVAGAALVLGRCGVVWAGERGPVGLSITPMLGEVTERSAMVWTRAAESGSVYYRVFGLDEDGAMEEGTEVRGVLDAREDNDLCVRIEMKELRPATQYGYQFFSDAEYRDSMEGGDFWTLPDPARGSIVRMAIGSCANYDLSKGPPGDKDVWWAIAATEPTVLALIGDTPYIDSTELKVQREKYRMFFEWGSMRGLRRNVPLIAVWDDHDFGKNDTDGRLKGKENARQAFIEYHAQSQHGDGAEGIYSRQRVGGMDVFTIDARWFSNRDEKKLLGEKQWAWLEQGLKESDAPFKVLMTGMIWNESVRPLKTDYWAFYAEERKRLFAFIEKEKIDGVVLVGGDIHRSRHLKHPSSTRGVGYPLHEIITSPLGPNVHANAKVDHPALVWDAGEPFSFCVLEVDSNVYEAHPERTLRVMWRNVEGKVLNEVLVKESELQSR
jgi:alkaline phosphatase D